MKIYSCHNVTTNEDNTGLRLCVKPKNIAEQITLIHTALQLPYCFWMYHLEHGQNYCGYLEKVRAFFCADEAMIHTAWFWQTGNAYSLLLFILGKTVGDLRFQVCLPFTAALYSWEHDQCGDTTCQKCAQNEKNALFAILQKFKFLTTSVKDLRHLQKS